MVLILNGVLYCCTTIKTTDNEGGWVEENENPEISSEISDTEESAEYSPTEEEYNTIFNEINVVIEKLNKIIRNKQYNIWLTYLTEDYKKVKGNTKYLEKLSETPVIKKQKIKLRSLKDYFFYVVVPSRYNVKVDKIEHVDKTHVKAYTYINNEYIILYYLEKYDSEWKIGSW